MDEEDEVGLPLQARVQCNDSIYLLLSTLVTTFCFDDYLFILMVHSQVYLVLSFSFYYLLFVSISRRYVYKRERRYLDSEFSR